MTLEFHLFCHLDESDPPAWFGARGSQRALWGVCLVEDGGTMTQKSYAVWRAATKEWSATGRHVRFGKMSWIV